MSSFSIPGQWISSSGRMTTGKAERLKEILSPHHDVRPVPHEFLFDLTRILALPYVGKWSWNYFHKHSQIRLKPERRFFIWFKTTYLYSITRSLNPIHRLLFKKSTNWELYAVVERKGPLTWVRQKDLFCHTPSADKVPWI
jgi:hypothetical protein